MCRLQRHLGFIMLKRIRELGQAEALWLTPCLLDFTFVHLPIGKVARGINILPVTGVIRWSGLVKRQQRVLP
jgi:hypothetical protein